MDQWVTSTVLQGHFWKFRSCPPHCSFQSTKIQREKRNFASVCVNTTTSASNSTSPGFGEALRILFPSLFSPQEVGKMEACVGSEKAKQIHSCGTLLQDGVPKHSDIFGTTRRLDGLHRPPTCIPSHTCSSRLPAFSSISSFNVILLES